MSDAGESIVLCEGFDDRAFWQGLLLSLGCKDARREGAIHNFYASIWRDPEIMPKLRAILERTSAWATIVALVGIQGAFLDTATA
jgi:hypothetical protein